MTPRTPRSTPQQSPFTILSSDNNQQESPVRDEICAAPDQLFSPLDTASLLCTESMDLMDLDDGHQSNENTPHNDKRKKSKENARSKGINKSHGHRSSQKKNHPNEEKHRQARRCRRQLEKSFPTPEKHTLNTETPLITGVFENTDINGCQDFDGYFQFYQQMAAEYPETPETASRVAQMWRNMSPDSRDTFVAMAALDSQSVTSILSDFSDDLRDLELDPIIDCFQPSDQEESTPQCVPEYSGESPHQPGVDSRTFQTVPESPSDLSTYLKMGPGDPVARDHQHTYQDMFDSAAFNAGSIYQAAYMISANQFLDQSSGVQTLGNQSSTMSESSQAVPDIDLVLDHLIQVEDFRIPTS
ncbi:uncharacterized protein [Argopecten irradians]|uniref:uncharacterized protein n=1 Tax=Argopecten irradians TaxID=31199 RepID=UPI0037106EEE